MCSTTRREERGTFSKLNPPDLPPLHFYQRQSIKRPKIAPFSRNLFIQNPIPPKGTKANRRNFSIHAEHSLSYRRHVRIVSRARFAPFLRVLWRREVCGAKLLTRVERVAGSAVTFFGSHEIRKAGSTLRTVMVPQVCPMASFATFAASNSPFLTQSVRFLPISLWNVIDNRCIKRSLLTFPPFDFSRNRKSFFFLFLKSRVG